jgi:hypothetical protein
VPICSPEWKPTIGTGFSVGLVLGSSFISLTVTERVNWQQIEDLGPELFCNFTSYRHD